MSELDYLLLELKDYVESGNFPDINGEYPNPLEWEMGEVKLLLDYINNLQNQLQQKGNIIKEVREKLCKYGLVDKEGNFNAYLDTIELKELLEILNKEVIKIEST